jgi:hypothetical protein
MREFSRIVPRHNGVSFSAVPFWSWPAHTILILNQGLNWGVAKISAVASILSLSKNSTSFDSERMTIEPGHIIKALKRYRRANPRSKLGCRLLLQISASSSLISSRTMNSRDI